MNKIKAFTLGTLLWLGAVLGGIHPSSALASNNASNNSSWTRYQDYRVYLNAPQGWEVVRDLYGMPITVLGPEHGGERAILNIQDTPVRNLQFDHALIQNTKNDYYTGRKNWLD